MTARFVFLLFFLVAAAGCSGSGRVTAETPEAAFDKGKELYDREKYDRAVEYFQLVFDFGRTNAWADDAQFYLAQSYFQSKQYLLSANEFTRFVELYRTDERVEEGEYLRAESYYRLSPRYQRDQTDTQTALNYMRLYLSKYPSGQYTPEIGGKIDELRAKLARKQFETGEHYERRELYEAAGLSYLAVLESYPDSGYTDDALVGAVRAFKLFADASIPSKRQERYQQAADAYQQLVQLFPDSPLRGEADTVYAEVENALGRFDQAGR